MGGSGSKKFLANVPFDSTIKLELSKQQLDFNIKDEGCPLNHPIFDELEVKNPMQRRIKFKFEPVCPASCTVNFTPDTGIIERGRTKKVKVKFTMLQKMNVNFKVTLKIEGGASLFINLKVAGETGVFGVDPSTLEMVDDNGRRVPSVLVNIRNCLVKNNAASVEGIFRLAGEQTEIRRIKDLLNKKQFDFNTRDVNTMASLLKIWFRDLPTPILNALPQEQIMNSSDRDECVSAYCKLTEPQKTLLDWLMDFLTQISQNSTVNKMTSQNLAIVIAPNLYDISTPNPMEGLIMSQKCAQFLNHVLNARIHGLC